MQGHLHALLLLLALAAAAYACARWHARPGVGRVFLAIGGAVPLALVSFACGMHKCEQGYPVQQWLLPGVCFAAVVALVGDRACRRVLAGAFGVMMISLSVWFSALVHEPGYVGTATERTPLGSLEAARFWHSALTGIYRPAP